jgi:hypothetical protein
MSVLHGRQQYLFDLILLSTTDRIVIGPFGKDAPQNQYIYTQITRNNQPKDIYSKI